MLKQKFLPFLIIILLSACEKEGNTITSAAANVVNISAASVEITVVGQTNIDSDYEWGIAIGVTERPRDEYNYTKSGTFGSEVNFTMIYEDLKPNTTYTFQVFAEHKGSNYFEDQVFSFTTDSLFTSVGSTGPGGGLVYYVSPEGWAMEMSTTEHALNNWGCQNAVSGTSSEIGSGAENTALILNTCGANNTAPDICNNLTEGGQNDWHLPSRNDLQEINDSLVEPGYWTPTNWSYMSSTEYVADNSALLCFDFLNVNIFWTYKTGNWNFVAVRKFYE
jgi:hypothetical protein